MRRLEGVSDVAVPAKKVKKAGTKGRTQGLRKEKRPARNAKGRVISAIRIVNKMKRSENGSRWF